MKFPAKFLLNLGIICNVGHFVSGKITFDLKSDDYWKESHLI